MSGACGSICAAGEVCSLGACVTTTTTTTASTTTTVNALAPSLTKAFNQTSIYSGGTAQLIFTVTNPAGGPAVSDVSFTDTLPPGLRIAVANTGGTCVNAAAATVATADSVTVTNLQMPQGPTLCTVVVDVTNAPMQTGTCPNPDFTNTASNISDLYDVINDVTDACLTIED
jgi:uncharacterized repeat protein (TIGR01451 family)